MSAGSKEKDKGTHRGERSPKATSPKFAPRVVPPLSNYTLSTVCPACDALTYRHACKVRCPRCGFMWDCSEV